MLTACSSVVGQATQDPGNTSTCGELKIRDAARRIKLANPAARVFVYFPSSKDESAIQVSTVPPSRQHAPSKPPKCGHQFIFACLRTGHDESCTDGHVVRRAVRHPHCCGEGAFLLA